MIAVHGRGMSAPGIVMLASMLILGSLPGRAWCQAGAACADSPRPARKSDRKPLKTSPCADQRQGPPAAAKLFGSAIFLTYGIQWMRDNRIYAPLSRNSGFLTACVTLVGGAYLGLSTLLPVVRDAVRWLRTRLSPARSPAPVNQAAVARARVISRRPGSLVDPHTGELPDFHGLDRRP